MPSSLYRYARAHGVRQTAAAAWRAVRRRAYVDERLIVIVKDLDSIVEPARSPELRLEDLTVEHLSRLAQLNRTRGRPDIDRRFARYLEKGFHGFVAYAGEDPVGYYWWVDQDTPTLFPDLRMLGLGIELGEGEVYGSDLFLLEERRGGGAAGDLLFQVESALRERGYARIWGYVVSGNRPARWTYSMRGYMPMWTVKRRKVLFLHRTNRESS